MEEIKMKKVKILWTGGWDSTFRIIELSSQLVEIEPFYVIDHNRKSTEYELKAMNTIIELQNKKQETKATFCPIKIIKRDDIIPDEEISKAYKIINKETNLGSQQEWLARLGKTYPGLEMGTEAGVPDTSHIIDAIQKFGNLKFDENNIGYLDKESSSKEGLLVLGWFYFPIITKTEEDMLKIVQENGYDDNNQVDRYCATTNPLLTNSNDIKAFMNGSGCVFICFYSLNVFEKRSGVLFLRI